ncbi:MAG: RDD family protein [Bacteroidales bacterium]|nr:RDD family protein [Bacteroidales bacterium]
MDRVGINTTQNVILSTEPASVGERIVAAFFDYLVIGVYMFIISMILGILRLESIALVLILFLPAIFYSLILETANQGQTLGKTIMKIKVVNVNGSHPSFGSYFKRWIFRLVDVVMLSGGVAVLTIILNGKGQRLGDIAAKTMVIRLKNKVSINDTILIDTPESYDPVFREASRLSEVDIQIVKDVLNYLQKSPNSISNSGLVNKVKQKISSKLGINSTMEGQKFLETIIKDYNRINKG